MGQRLVISVYESKEDGTPVAALYYHWGAYTWSALDWTRQLVEYMDNNEWNDQKELALHVIRFAELSGGCIDGGKGSEEWKKIAELYPDEVFKETGSRNDGLVVLTEDGIAGLYGWASGEVRIALEEREVYFDVIAVYDSLEDYASNRDEELEDIIEEYGELPVLNWDASTRFLFSDIDGYLKDIERIDGYVFQNEKGEIFELYA